VIPLTEREVALAKKDKILAIKAYRLRTKLSLIDAKNHLEAQLSGGRIILCPACKGKGEIIQTEMTDTDRYLILEATLIACRSVLPVDLVIGLREWLHEQHKQIKKTPIFFNEFLKVQKDAVQKLLTDPKVFG